MPIFKIFFVFLVLVQTLEHSMYSTQLVINQEPFICVPTTGALRESWSSIARWANAPQFICITNGMGISHKAYINWSYGCMQKLPNTFLMYTVVGPATTADDDKTISALYWSPKIYMAESEDR